MLVFSLGCFPIGLKIISSTTMPVMILSFLFTNIAIFLVIHQYTYLSPFTILLVLFFPKYCICIRNFQCLQQSKLHSTFICTAEVPLWCWISICKVILKTTGGVLRAVGEAAVDREKLEDLFKPHIVSFTASALQQHCRKQNNSVSNWNAA